MIGANFLMLMVVYCLGLTQAINQHLICKSVQEIFSPAENTMHPNRGVTQGAPGKRGAPGLRGIEGPNGPRGPPGIVDYDKVNSTIDEKLQPVISSFCGMERAMEEKMENLVTQLTSKIENLTETFPTRIFQRQGLCDVWYNNSCFWAIIHSSYAITQSKAESICSEFGASVADIYDETHYDLLVTYLRKKIPDSGQYCFQLGLTYDYSANVARRQSGVEAFARWYPGAPYRGSSTYTTILIYLYRNAGQSGQGIYNTIPNYNCNGVVCELQGV